MKEMKDELYLLMAHAEDLQKIADKSIQAVDNTAKRLEKDVPESILNAIKTDISENLNDTKKELSRATKALLNASAEARLTCSLMKRTGLYQGFFLAMVVLVMGLIVWFGAGYFINSRIEELAGLKNAIEAERETLVQLQSKTWNLELVTYGDGTKAILLPKGVKFSHDGAIQDGSGRIGLVIK